MEDEPKPLVGKTLRTVTTAVSLTFSLGLIIYLVWDGNPENSLHQSALSWGFTILGVLLAGVGFSAITPVLPGLVNRRST